MRYSELSRTLLAGETRTVYGWAADLLERLARGTTRLPAVRHPLGFVCYPVERDGPDGVCLHVWDRQAAGVPASELTTSDVHAHSWDLLSLVLYGEVRNTVFDAMPASVSDSGQSDQSGQPGQSGPDAADEPLRLCEVHSERGNDEILATDRLVRLVTRRSELHGTGSVYTLPAGVFHTSLVNDVAATVALGHGVPEAVDLSVGSVHTRTHEVHRTRCSAAEAERTARQTLALLRGGAHDARTGPVPRQEGGGRGSGSRG